MLYKSRKSRGLTRKSYRPKRRMRPRRKPMTAGKVKRIIDAELKVRDFGVGPVPIPSATGSVVQISNIGQGDTNVERQGNWIKPVSFMGTFTVEGNTASALETQQFRIGCFVWKENQDVDPATLIKLVQDTVAPHQGFNIESKGSFKILYSRVGIVSTSMGNSNLQKMYRFYVKPNMKILYDDADFRKYHLFVFGYSNIDTAANPPDYSFDVRLRYTDS